MIVGRYFVDPNWHVLFLHLPLGVLLVGIVIEIVTLFVRRQSLRNAGRWMILIGSLGAVETTYAGIYAFRDVVAQVPTIPQFAWHDLVAKSTFSAAQWDFMEDHISGNITATALAVIGLITFLAASDSGRAKLYWPILVLFMVVAGLLCIAAWNGGEAVYRFGTAVLRQNPVAVADTGQRSEITYFIQPLQLHIVLAGLVAVLMILGLAFTASGWFNMEQAAPRAISSISRYAGLVWCLALFAAILTACAGLSSVLGRFTASAFSMDIEMLKSPEHQRLLVHLLSGLTFALLLLAIAIVTSLRQRKQVLAGILATIILIAAALLVWFGVLMLYDSHGGPLFRFSS
jgi:uncharacterized membrane protein